MSKGTREYDLEDRLIDFTIRIIRTAEALPKTKENENFITSAVRNSLFDIRYSLFLVFCGSINLRGCSWEGKE